MANTFNTPHQDLLVRHLLSGVNEALLAAAEPISQDAMQKIEREMREALAAKLISVIEMDIDVFRNERRLVLTINQAAPKENAHHSAN